LLKRIELAKDLKRGVLSEQALLCADDESTLVLFTKAAYSLWLRVTKMKQGSFFGSCALQASQMTKVHFLFAANLFFSHVLLNEMIVYIKLTV